MSLKIYLLCIIAALCPLHTIASSYLRCSNEQDCKFSMQHEYAMNYHELLKHTLREVFNVFDNLGKTLHSEYSADASNQAKVHQILERLQQQRSLLDGREPVSLEQLKEIRQKGLEIWTELKQVLPAGFVLAPYEERIRKLVDVKDFLDIWRLAAALRNNVEVTGFNELNQEVQRVKDLEFNNENRKTFFDLHAKILKFYNLEYLIPENHK